MADRTQCKDFEALILQHVELVYSVALQLTSTPPEAETLAQDTLAKAWEARDSLGDATSLKMWLLSNLRAAFTRKRHRPLPVAQVRIGAYYSGVMAATGN